MIAQIDTVELAASIDNCRRDWLHAARGDWATGIAAMRRQAIEISEMIARRDPSFVPIVFLQACGFPDIIAPASIRNPEKFRA